MDLAGVIKSGKTNRPGFGKKLLVALISDFETIATPTLPGTVAGDEVKITTAHTFKAGKGFKVLETTDEFNELTGEVIGDRDSRGESQTMTARHPGLEAEVLEFKKKALGQEFIMLLPNLDGTYRQVGTEEDPMECQSSSGSGTKSGGYKGITFTFSGYSEIYIYSGDIVIESEIV